MATLALGKIHGSLATAASVCSSSESPLPFFAFSKAAAAVEHGAARQEHAEELLDRGKEPFCWYSMGQAFPGRRPCRSGDIAHVLRDF